MEMCKCEVCMLVLSPYYQVLSLQIGFCTFKNAFFCLVAHCGAYLSEDSNFLPF